VILNPTMKEVVTQFEAWTKNPESEDVRPLAKAAIAHLRSGNVLFSEYAPCLAILTFSIEDFEHSWLSRLMWRTVAKALMLIYRGRPMWNDYYMGLWQLSRDPRYIGRLYDHLVKMRHHKQNSAAFSLGLCMVESVSQQDPVFAEHWQDLESEKGAISPSL